jgi:hypothetical protein
VEELDGGTARRGGTSAAGKRERMGGGTARRSAREGEVDARGGGGTCLQSDGGRFSAKRPRNQNFVFSVDRYFGIRGVFCNNFERVC